MRRDAPRIIAMQIALTAISAMRIIQTRIIAMQIALTAISAMRIIQTRISLICILVYG